MVSNDTTVWIRHEASACAPCHAGDTVPACAAPAEPAHCATPEFRGDAATLQRLLRALRTVSGPQPAQDIVEAGQIQSLRVGDGEAELVLTFAPTCGLHQQAADAAFQVLRRELPDTDVYVLHPRG